MLNVNIYDTANVKVIVNFGSFRNKVSITVALYTFYRLKAFIDLKKLKIGDFNPLICPAVVCVEASVLSPVRHTMLGL